MAKERTSAAFRAFLGGVDAIRQTQEQRFREEETQKARDFQAGEAEKTRANQNFLSQQQINAAAKNLRIQIENSQTQHKQSLEQAKYLTEQGWLHNAQLQTEKIQADLKLHNATMAATKNYQVAGSYDTARDTQLAFQKQGIDGYVTQDANGFSRFIPTGKIAPEQPNVNTVAGMQKPIPTEYPGKNPLQTIGSFTTPALLYKATSDILHKYYPELGNPMDKFFGYTRPEEDIQKSDLNKVEPYAKTVSETINKDPKSLQDPRMLMALDAINNIINRSEYSQKQIQKDITKPASREIQSYIKYLMSMQGQKK